VTPLRDLAIGQTEEPTYLVVVLHGWGDEGKNVGEFANIFARIMPFAAFHLPTAPFPVPDGGFDWLGSQGVRSSAPQLDAFIDAAMEKYRLDEARTLLVGMAEGTMACLHVGLRRAKKFAAIVGFCGMLAEPETLAAEIKSRPPVFLAHGDKDETIPLETFARSAKALHDNGVEAELYVAKGIGHTIDTASISQAWRFMYRVMGMKVPQ
jgi:phospholipase/carboxylesterase